MEIKKGDILSLPVSGIGKKKDFFVKHKGYVIFLKDPNPERVKDLGTKKIKDIQLNKFFKVRVTKLFEKVAYAEAVR